MCQMCCVLADSSKPFSWKGKGSQVFGQVPTVVEDENPDDGDVVPSQDIHFEPVVQLAPVEVSKCKKIVYFEWI